MYCWYCHRPIIVKMVVRSIAADTQPVNDHVRVVEQKVKCNSCGAEYVIETYLDKKPTVSHEMLLKLDNIIHP